MRMKMLLIEDDKNFVNAVRLMMRSHPVDVVWASTGAEGIQAFRKNQHGFATVIVDYCLPDLKGSEVALTIKKLNTQQDILFASGFNDPNNLIDLLETGGSRSFIYKGRPPEEIAARILDSLTIYEKQNRVLGADFSDKSEIEADLRRDGIIGRSKIMHDVLKAARKYREEPFPTLIIGETGSGKELIAKALIPTGKQMIVVDCPRYSKSENLLESDLFGHVKGAFTGADKDKPGLLSQAHGQVIFLDELHQLSLDAQTKLLRFLQEMKYRRLGDHSGREIPVQFKLIAAAKPDIFERIKDGTFLEDLYHRVGRLEVRVPSLRERLDDLEPLVRHFQDEINALRLPGLRKQFRISTIVEMSKYPWPGNIRELQNIVTRLMTDTSGDIINPEDFKNIKTKDSRNVSHVSIRAAKAEVEASAIISALHKSQSKADAAEILGITRWALNRTMSRLGINPEQHLVPNKRRENAC
ncbi:MAG TPA: sigma 54-interacting transcriptional regulator [Bdellovibrionales bacterium]|mgnify:CR=1 FL=1|nr:sigma 54-interacting transcriptional regulator [Bdellovibrionales bacterium]